MKKVTYIRCPRCELNYITKEEKYCSVCKQEMQVGGGSELDELDLELCPICKTNYINPSQVMCDTCYAERKKDSDFDADSDEWARYINDDEDQMEDSQDEEIGEMSSVKIIGMDDDDLDDGLDIDDDDLDGLSLDEDDEDDQKIEEEDDFDDDDDFDMEDDFDDDDDEDDDY